RRQRALHPRQGCIHQLQRAVHVHVPLEEEVDFGGAAAGDRPQVIEPLHRIDGFLKRPRDRDQHLVDRHHAIIHAHYDAREIRFWKNCHRNRERQERTYRDQRQDHEDNGFAKARRPVRRATIGRRQRRVAHCFFALPSSFFFWSLPLGFSSSGSFSSGGGALASTTLTFCLSST